MILTAVLAAQLAGTLDFSDTTRADLRWTTPLEIVSTPRLEEVVIAGDVTTIPAARMALRTRRFTFNLAYAPNIIATDVELQPQTQPVLVLHTATVGASWVDRMLRLGVTESASFGLYNPALLYGGATAAGATVGQNNEGNPTGMTQGTQGTGTMMTGPGGTAVTSTAAPKVVTAGSSTTTGILGLQPSRRLFFTASGGYSIAGGVDSASRVYEPQSYGPFAAASAGYRVSGTETLTTVANAQQAVTEGACPLPVAGGLVLPATDVCKTETLIANLQEVYAHTLSTRARLSLGAGISFEVAPTALANETNVAPYELSIVPNVTSTFTYRFEGTETLTTTVILGPQIDARTGLPSERIQGAMTLTSAVTKTFTVLATAGLLQSVPVGSADPYSLSLVSGTIEARLPLTQALTLTAGVSGLWEGQSGEGDIGSLVGYVGVIARAPTLRF
jgi:hypothetical protein